MRDHEFKAKLENGLWADITHCRNRSHFSYPTGDGERVQKINHSTTCQLITKVGENKIYEYDCWVNSNRNILSYMYYTDDGILLLVHKQIYSSLTHLENMCATAVQYRNEYTDGRNIIGNWHDGEEYLLNQIKELK
jgi:hypothetical protein